MMEQLLCHLVGDYILQSDWMASKKRQSYLVALAHAATYTLPFLFITQDIGALLTIFNTHAAIDHFGLARYVVFAKNFIAPPSEWPVWERCAGNGHDKDRPVWLSTWLLIIADNTLHLLINALALSA